MSAKTFINALGNTVAYEFVGPFRERYHYDSQLLPLGYQQYDTDQDASYFGVWVHVEDRKILTFAEGDETIVDCPTAESFAAELTSMAECYGDPPPAFTVLDSDGTVTHVFDERPTANA